MALPTWVKRRKIDVNEYHRMGHAGILREDDRVELIAGELVVMSPIGSPHAGMVNKLTKLLVLTVGDRATVSVQNPVRLSRDSEPQPDLTILRPRADFYQNVPPRPDDVLLLIEVADSSLRFDRTAKQELYALHGIREYWIVNLDAGEVEIHLQPEDGRYQVITPMAGGTTLVPKFIDGICIAHSDLFG
jgi:Uma2 family endonuclease